MSERNKIELLKKQVLIMSALSKLTDKEVNALKDYFKDTEIKDYHNYMDKCFAQEDAIEDLALTDGSSEFWK